MRVDDVCGLLDNLAVAPFDAMPLRQAHDFDEKFLTTERQFEIIVRACCQSVEVTALACAQGAGEKDRNISRARVLLEATAQLQPIHLRHNDITNHNVRLCRERHLQSRRSILSREDFVVLLFENHG